MMLLMLCLIWGITGCVPAPLSRVGSVLAATRHYALQADTWMARKAHYQIMAPQIGAICTETCLDGNRPRMPEHGLLNTAVVATTIEPNADGIDSAGQPYTNIDMWYLCGPAAAVNALAFWGAPVNRFGTNRSVDRADGIATTWDDQYQRSYMQYLAWAVQPPGWSPGMMDSSHNPSYGVRLYDMRDALNWVASGENAATYANFFYSIRWWDDPGVTAGTLRQDVENDIVGDGVPVVAEINAHLLPNWPNSAFWLSNAHPLLRHFITIIGFDNLLRNADGSIGVYYYTDTCGQSTGCGSLDDGGVQQISQDQLWQAITDVPVNRSGAANASDGGWVW